MLAFGFSSGLPFALLIGTLNAWLGDAKINLATIGVLSWIGLGYAFKFLWSPLVDRVAAAAAWPAGPPQELDRAVPGGPDRCPSSGSALTDPATSIGGFAIFAVIGAFASATQDIAVDAWRIDVADEKTPVELLSAVYQFGYRTASIVGGAFALLLAARMPWGSVYLVMAGWSLVVMVVAFTAPDTPAPAARRHRAGLEQAGRDQRRGAALRLVDRRRLLALGDRLARSFHGLDAAPRSSRNEAAVGRRFHHARRAVDHRRDGVRAAGHRGGRQLAEGARRRRPERSADPASRAGAPR